MLGTATERVLSPLCKGPLEDTRQFLVYGVAYSRGTARNNGRRLHRAFHSVVPNCSGLRALLGKRHRPRGLLKQTNRSRVNHHRFTENCAEHTLQYFETKPKNNFYKKSNEKETTRVGGSGCIINRRGSLSSPILRTGRKCGSEIGK